MGFRFFAVPTHRVVASSVTFAEDELIQPDADLSATIERALQGVEYRDLRARDKLRQLLHSETPPPLGKLKDRCGPSALFAQPPQDLPALLRMADQLDKLAQLEAGERALVWKCVACGTRYAVPVALVRNVAIRCERCGESVELNPSRSLGEEALLDPFQGEVNVARRRLAEFLREAMARGWSVLVCSEG